MSFLRRLFPKKKTLRADLGFGAVFRYKVGYRRNGVNYFPRDWRNNLILDSGLNKIANFATQDCWAWCLFGDQVGPTPVQRNSGAVTFTTTGTACVASAGFFVSQDVGRLIKFDDTDGQERYITAFTDSTHVTLGVAPSPAIAAQTATVWYVNETALDSLYSATGTYQQNAGDNETTAVANVVTYKRTFIGGAVSGSPVTLTEIGFSESGANANLFDRDIITGGITLSVGDQPLAVAELIVTFSPAVSTAVGNVATGYDSSGDMIISGLDILSSLAALSFVDTNGQTTANANAYEPSEQLNGMRAIMSSFSLPAFSNGTGPNIGGIKQTSQSLGSYSAGNFFRDLNGSYDVSTANGTIYGFCLQAGASAVWVLRLTTPFTKLSTQTLTVSFRRSWQRLLQN